MIKAGDILKYNERSNKWYYGAIGLALTNEILIFGKERRIEVIIWEEHTKQWKFFRNENPGCYKKVDENCELLKG